MKTAFFLKNNFIYNSRKSLLKTNIFVLGGVFLFLLSSVITISTSIPIITESIRDNIFYRETMISNLSKLTVGTQISSFEVLIGKPTFIFDVEKKSNDTFKMMKPAEKEYVFVNNFFYIDALVDSNGNVTQFAVTTRDSKFNPKFITSLNGDKFDIILGKSKFKDLPTNPELIKGCLGAHTWYYYETYYMGNPGNYQTYAFGFNMSGHEGSNFFDFSGSLSVISSTNCPGIEDKTSNESEVNTVELDNWRNNITINTYLITAPFYGVTPNNLGIGVDYNQVRILKN